MAHDGRNKTIRTTENGKKLRKMGGRNVEAKDAAILLIWVCCRRHRTPLSLHILAKLGLR
jgi:hypothetical protein